jgi:RNA 2',3'-cyclic 3'-phosphodiesterase
VRLFVAVDPPARVRGHLEAGTAALRESMDGWRWVPPEQWHLTLAFLGEVADDRLPELTRRMGLAARRHEPFTVDLAGVGAFNSLRRARVMWVGVDGDREALTRLADSVGAGARRAKIALDERRYRPHMTLGRRRAPADVSDLLGAGRDYRGPAWTVEEFVLVQSHLGRAVRHELRERFPLGKRPPDGG